MDVITIVVIAIAVVVIAALGWYAWQQRQSKVFAERFGPEYQRVVSEEGSRRRAEAELRHREERVEHLDIRPLTAQQQADYMRLWRATQTRFVDSSGLGALFALYQAANNNRDGVTLRLVNPRPSIQQLFELTQLHQLFEIERR